MVDKVALGRQGEIFVMQKMMERGWKFPENYHENMEGLDWVFEKGGKIIKIQVKTSLKKFPTISIGAKKNFDFLMFTNLKDCLVIPKQLLSNNSNKITKTFRKLKNKFHLQELLGVDLLSAINDCGIRFSEINQPSLILRQELPAIVG